MVTLTIREFIGSFSMPHRASFTQTATE